MILYYDKINFKGFSDMTDETIRQQVLPVAKRINEEVKKAVIGKNDIIVKTLLAIIAGGHILLDDIPGV